MEYRYAKVDDSAVLACKRMRSLGVKETDEAYSGLYHNCLTYFLEAIPAQTCDAVLAQQQGDCVGVGILFYYSAVPSVFNPEGKNAYLSCMYVEPDHRRKGVGSGLLKRLTHIAQSKGYDVVLLNTTDMGRPMYEKVGFRPVENAMVCKMLINE